MQARVQNHIRNNVIGYIAIFLFAMGGSAYALDGSNTVFSDDIVDGEVKEADVGQGAVASPEVKNDSILPGDVAPNSLTSGRIADGSLTGADVASNSLKGVDIDESTLSSIGGGGPAGGDLTGTYPDPEIAPDAVGTSEVADGSLTGADVDESTLGQVPSAQSATLGGIGRHAGSGSCDPESETFVTCASVALNLPAPARVLVVGSVDATTEVDSDSGAGECRVSTDRTGFLTASNLFIHVGDLPGDEQVPLTTVTPAVGPGNVTFRIVCNQASFGAIDYVHGQISAVGLSPN